MRQRLSRLLVIMGVALAVVFTATYTRHAAAASPNTAGESRKEKEKKKTTKTISATPTAQDGELIVTVTPWGPTQDTLDALLADLPQRRVVSRALRGSNYRFLSIFLIDNPDKSGELQPPTRYRAIYYDYSHNQTVTVEGNIYRSGEEKVFITKDQPLPSPEEFDAAVARLQQDDTFGAALRDGTLIANPAMPPVLYPEVVGGDVERTLNVLLLSAGGKSEFSNEVVGVNMIRNEVVRFKGGAPPTSLAAPQACGIPAGSGGSSSSGTAGQYQFTISQNGAEMWSYLAIRPANSSGASDRSGIELQNVKYRGKLLLKRIHTPILNVDYVDNSCGPYRDWQWQEGAFQANGTDIPGTNGGVRDCGTNVATTALDTGNDNGNFRGIAFYRQGNEVVMVSEMNAGWYRYIAEYRLASNGTIRPRYGYGATNNSCVCSPHNHHVYWRFDFDIDGAENNVIRPARTEFTWGAPYTTETRLSRNQTNNRLNSWLVQNTQTGSSYMVRSNGNDGTANSYGRGDLWFLRYKANEISDRDAGVYTGTAANINAFVNSESLNTDIVMWYGGHFLHNESPNNPDITGPNILTGTHVQGPDIIPVRW